MPQYGFFSAKAAKAYGTVYYKLTNTQTAEVTCVCNDPTGSEYKWDDKEYVGEIASWVCVGRKA